MNTSYIQYRQSIFSYLRSGTGPEIIICLHGYGETASSFEVLTGSLPAAYTLIAPDLPFHGKTAWNENRFFTIEDLLAVLTEIFKSLQLEADKFIVMGYSMGGRIAMSIAQAAPEKTLRLILLAPDGIVVNFWYWLSTQTQAGNRLFKSTVNNPAFILKTLKLFHRLRFINKSIIRFVNTYLEEHSMRSQLYDRWTCMQTFKPDLKKLRKIIREKQMVVRFLYGRHDRIITSSKAGKLMKGLEAYCTVEIIDTGHQLLQKKFAATITKLLTT